EAVEISVAPSYEALADRVERGHAELVWMPPTITARLLPELHAVYKCVRLGQTSYRSGVVARAGAFESLQSLRGGRAAWVDRLSIGGHILARSALVERGIADELASEVFYGDYPSALDAVLEGDADFAAVAVCDDSDESLRDALASFGGRAAAQELVRVHVTVACPNDALGVTRSLDAAAADRIAARVFADPMSRARAALCLALDAEGFAKAEAGEYSQLRSLIVDR
ncbi:MAG TPA: hypothetical protein ENK57_13315, partial [Polyangiaceae bacterium]|nr:hypothetical protein [Polyangiaceae bacterium]